LTAEADELTAYNQISSIVVAVADAVWIAVPAVAVAATLMPKPVPVEPAGCNVSFENVAIYINLPFPN
jgi:hypothetical protein